MLELSRRFHSCDVEHWPAREMAMIGIGWELGIFGEARCCLKWDLRFIGGLVLMYVALGDRAVLSCPHQMVLVYCGSYVNTWTFCCDCYYVVY